ncbi:MAG TPA: VOC family protein [Fimbriimonadaceae bacterium]|nr:VOC family protein [Fimbriimonadaceae bacterium]HRJ32116.1 VOC family protein [Fimbriimonadaceae bacterium]
MTYHRLCHLEFEVTDMDRARHFYQGLFGWNFRAFTDSMVVFGIGDEHLGGLQKVDHVKPGSSPSVWFNVESLEASVARVVELGGSTPHEKHPVPGVGWSVAVLDPDGNPVGLVEFAS